MSKKIIFPKNTPLLSSETGYEPVNGRYVGSKWDKALNAIGNRDRGMVGPLIVKPKHKITNAMKRLFNSKSI